MIALIIEDKIKSISPNPDIEIGPNMVTTIPPPIRIKSHIPKIKPNIPIFKFSHPSKRQ